MERAASAMPVQNAIWHPMPKAVCACMSSCQSVCATVARVNTEHTTEYNRKEACDEHVSCRYMYLSIDEAATHVGNKRFRLVAMVYEQNGQDLIGTTCSQPIRVMANNDVPTGAAHISLSCNIRSSDWLPYLPLVVQVCKFGMPAPYRACFSIAWLVLLGASLPCFEQHKLQTAALVLTF